MRLAAPAYGAHTSDVLVETGFNKNKITELLNSGAAIQGMTVDHKND